VTSTDHGMEGDPSSIAWPAKAQVVAPPAAVPSQAELVHTIWSLAWPVIVTFLLESLVGLIDTLMVGRLGAAAVAAVGVGTQILSAVSVVMTAVGTGTLALVARHIGARQRRAAEDILLQSILAAVGLSLIGIVPVIVLAPRLVQLFGVDVSVASQGGSFVRLVMLSIPQSAVLFVIGSALRAAGDTRTPLAIGATVNALNIVGNYVLIFGKCGLPALGVDGSALATTLAFTIGMAIGMALLLRGQLVLAVHRRGMRLDAHAVRRVLAIGYPAAAEQILMQIGFFFYLAFAAHYGTSALAGYFIGVKILALSFLPGYGFAAAAGALVGQNLGAGNPDTAERSGWAANRMAIGLMSVCGIILFVAARPIAAMFVDDAEVVADTVSFIRTLAAAQPLMAIDFTMGGALRGAGDTRFPLIAVFVGFYGCRLAFAYVATFVLHLSLPWVWFALIGDYIARASLKAWRFRGGRWRFAVV
jgi:putative MATE family efflux protein